MKKLLILLFLSINLSSIADSNLDFTLSDFCHKAPGVQDREGVFYFPNEEREYLIMLLMASNSPDLLNAKNPSIDS